MTDQAESITGLAAAASHQDRDALNRLIDIFYKDVFRMVYYRTGSRMDAEDIAQDIFLRVVEKLPSLRDKTLFRPWLYRIAVNRVNDFHRRKKITSLFDGGEKEATATPDSNPGASDAVEKKEFAFILNSFSDALSRWEKEIFLLRFLDGLEIMEIARTLKKNENTIKTHLYRAIAKFKHNPEMRQWLKGHAQ